MGVNLYKFNSALTTESYQEERFKYWLSNYIVVYPTNKMAQKSSSSDKGLDGTALAILKSFFPEGGEKTLTELQERAQYSHEPMHRVLSQLVQRKILTSKKVGKKTLLYSLDMTHRFAKLAYYHYATEQEHTFVHKHPTLTLALEHLPKNKIEALIIFGSYAKGNESEKSDIDILAVSSDKKEVEQEIKALTHCYKKKEFHAVVVPRSEFVKIKKENKEFWHDLVRYGIIFKGSEILYENAYLS